MLARTLTECEAAGGAVEGGEGGGAGVAGGGGDVCAGGPVQDPPPCSLTPQTAFQLRLSLGLQIIRLSHLHSSKCVFCFVFFLENLKFSRTFTDLLDATISSSTGWISLLFFFLEH